MTRSRYENRNRKIDDSLSRSSMSGPMQYGWDCKAARHSNIDWQIIRKFLRSKVGKFWPKVYSEISEKNPEWIPYLKYHVCEKVYKEGRVFKDSEGNEVFDEFFVHPISNCLERTKVNRWKKR